jgi:hypothetical protein
MVLQYAALSLNLIYAVPNMVLLGFSRASYGG